MSEGCPKGKVPAVCLTTKDRIEAEIKLKNKGIVPYEAGFMVGQYTLESSKPVR